MTGQARRGKTPHVTSPLVSLGDEGAERYMWAFREGNQVVLAIPGLRDLTTPPAQKDGGNRGQWWKTRMRISRNQGGES
jgi:hypothetical protein